MLENKQSFSIFWKYRIGTLASNGLTNRKQYHQKLKHDCIEDDVGYLILHLPFLHTKRHLKMASSM